MGKQFQGEGRPVFRRQKDAFLAARTCMQGSELLKQLKADECELCGTTVWAEVIICAENDGEHQRVEDVAVA